MFLRTNTHRFDTLKFTRSNWTLYMYCEKQIIDSSGETCISTESMHAHFGNNNELKKFCKYLENFFNIKIERNINIVHSSVDKQEEVDKTLNLTETVETTVDSILENNIKDMEYSILEIVEIL